MPRTHLTCPVCSRPYSVPNSYLRKGRGKTCSPACSAVSRFLKPAVYTGQRRERIRANGRLNMAIRRGDIARPSTCQQCGKPCRPDGHHTDYSKPFQVEWLCRSCHTLRHPKPQTAA